MPPRISLSPSRRRRLCLGAGIWLVVACLLVMIQGHLRINTTHSSPPGLYALVTRPLTHGAYVVTCLPEQTTRYGREQAYLRPGSCPGGGVPVLKRVAALPGDTVRVTDSEMITDSLNLPRRDTDLVGRPVRAIAPGHYTVEPGTVWLYSDYTPRSWDSRYWGPVPTEPIQTAIPLWTFP